MSRGRHRRTSRRGPLVTAALLLLAAAALAVPGASGGFLARVTNNANTASSNLYFTCTAAEQGPGAANSYFAYPFSEANGVLGATDISGNLRTGAYSLTGVTYNVANGGVCPRDKNTVITLDGTAGNVSGPIGSITGPNTFSVEVWFRTTAKQGKLIGFGTSRTGLSGSYDRHLYIGTDGKLVFGVYPNAFRTLTSPAVVTDGAWHQAVGTLSSAGMTLYIDGVQVGQDTATTSAQSFTGYWRIGYDTLNAGWVNSPANYYFNGSIAFAAAYSTALTATQVSQHYTAGR